MRMILMVSLFFSAAEVCPICKEEFRVKNFDRNIIKLSQKSADRINESSRKRGQNDVVVRVGQRVHNYCRGYWNPESIKRDLSIIQRGVRR